MVQITVHGKNKGKMGIVKEFRYDSNLEPCLAYIEPYQCEFEFYEGRALCTKDGLYGWNNYGISRVKDTSSLLLIPDIDPIKPGAVTDCAAITLDLDTYDIQTHTENNKLIISWQPKTKGDK
jgi:hypothetical protein